MDRFLSNFLHNVDSKGRVSVPAPFRQIIATRGIASLFALRSLDRPAIDVGGQELMDRSEARLSRLDPDSPEYMDILTLGYGDGTVLKTDSEGRIMMTDFIREHTGIADKVTFVGLRDTFQLWEPERFESFRDQLRKRAIAERGSGQNSAGSSGQ